MTDLNRAQDILTAESIVEQGIEEKKINQRVNTADEGGTEKEVEADKPQSEGKEHEVIEISLDNSDSKILPHVEKKDNDIKLMSDDEKKEKTFSKEQDEEDIQIVKQSSDIPEKSAFEIVEIETPSGGNEVHNTEDKEDPKGLSPIGAILLSVRKLTSNNNTRRNKDKVGST